MQGSSQEAVAAGPGRPGPGRRAGWRVLKGTRGLREDGREGMVCKRQRVNRKDGHLHLPALRDLPLGAAGTSPPGPGGGGGLP